MSEPVPCDLCGEGNARYYPNIAHREDIVQCQNCGLVYTSPRPPLSQALDVGASDPEVWRDQEVIALMHRPRFEGMLRDLRSLSRGGRLLDVGCGAGHVLNLAREMGWEVFGVELQPSLADYARSRYGLEVSVGQLWDVKYPSEFFDVVTLWQVLEHVPSPTALLSEARRVLKGGGLLSIGVPNVESQHARTLPSWWVQYHYFYFSRRTLEEYLLKHHFQVGALVTHPHVPQAFRRLRSTLWRMYPLARPVLGLAAALGLGRWVEGGGISLYARKEATG